MLSRCSLVAALALLLSPLATAQAPSASRIRSDVRSHVSSGATNITMVGNGTRSWNRGAWEFARTITYEVPYAEMEGVTVEVYGDIVYQGGRYHSFRPGTQRYLGIDLPDPAEIDALFRTQLDQVFPLEALDEGYSYEILSDPAPTWHGPLGVSFQVRTRSKHRQTARILREVEAIRKVRMSREDVAGPWTYFVVSTESSEEVGREERPEAELDRMRRLFDVARIVRAEAEAGAVPEIDFKEFDNGNHLVVVTYKMLREADPATLEAYLRAVMAKEFYEEGSTTALNANGQALVDLALEHAHENELTYADQHCEALALDVERTEAARNAQVHIRSIFDTPPRGQGNSWSTVMHVYQTVAGYRNGEQVPGPWKLFGLTIVSRDSPDNRAWLNSFDDRSMVCPNNEAWNARWGHLTPSNH